MPFLTALHLFFVFVLGQGLFLTIMFLTLKKGDRTSNRLLAAVVLAMTYYTFTFLLHDTGFRRYFPILLINGYSLSPVIPVLFYLYLKQATQKNLGGHYFLHFIPFVIQFIYWLPNNASGLFHTISREALDTYYSDTIVNSVALIHVAIFLTYNYLLFFKINLAEDDKTGKIKWLKRIRLLYTLLAAIFTGGTLGIMFFNAIEVRYVFFPFMAWFIYTIGYYGYVKSAVVLNSIDRPKYIHSKLSPDESVAIYEQLREIMEKERVYLNPAIKLRDLAHKLGTSSHHVSRAINENSGTSFLDFINHYRVEEAKKIIKNDPKGEYKMLAVALDSGFNNKVSFYRYFKKFTNYLPMEYRTTHSAKLTPSIIK